MDNSEKRGISGRFYNKWKGIAFIHDCDLFSYDVGGGKRIEEKEKEALQNDKLMK